MSGSTIGGVVGAVVGFFIPGVGPQVGWMIGSAIGGYVDPTQVYGPRLSDTRGQTSQVGGSIPRAWGTAPVPGNVLWQQPGITEHRHTDDGKGSGTEQVTYTYTRSYAIMFHLGEITGVLQIKRNGKIVYDARDEATLLAEYEEAMGPLSSVEDWASRVTAQAAMNARFMSRCVIYNGTQTQEPDPTIEAYKGVGNASAYRGRAYFVVTDDETQAGEIAQYEVIVAACGTTNVEGGGQVASLLIVGTSADSGTSNADPCWANVDVLYPPSFVGIEKVAGETDIDTNPIPAYFGGVYSVIGLTDGVGRYSNDGQNSWHASSSPVGLYTHTAGPSGFLGHSGPIDRKIYKASATAPSSYTEVVGAPSVSTGGVRYTGSMYVLYGNSVGDGKCRLHMSSDGDTWDERYVATTGNGYAEIFDVVEHSGDIYVSGRWFDGTSKYQVRRSTDGGETLPELILEDNTNVPYHIESGGGVLCILTKNGYSYSSADGFASANACGLVDTWDGRGRYLEYAGGYFYAIGSHAGLLIYSVASSDAITWSTKVDIGLGSAEALVGDTLDPSGTPVPDAPGWYVDENGDLTSADGYETVSPCAGVQIGEIVADLCEQSGLAPDEYDVSELTDTVDGYVIARETDAASVIESLRPVGMFDPAEWDGKLRFVKRGGTTVGSINGDDLVERDGDAFEREMVQEVELLRKVTVGYLDTVAGWAPNTQAWERTAGTVSARGESVIEVTAVFGADQAATVAKRKGLTAWGEPEKHKLSLLSLRHAKYTPTDILNYTDVDAEVHTIRLMQIEDDSGVREIESSLNCAEAYDATATGVAPKPPTITDASLLGPTRLVVMDLPLWRSSDADDIGLYVGGSGYLGSWSGAQVDVSEDGGTTYTTVAQITEEAVIGYTTTALTAWESPENPEEHEVTVYLPEAPSSVSYETLLRYANRAAVQLDSGGWEILQYETATALGDDLYTLSGLIRGRYNTDPGVVSADATFVLLNSSVQFVRAERDSLGQTLTVRATTYGTSSDGATPFDFEFTQGASQTEWPVHGVEASRDGSDNVTVTWIGRARLGTETSPYHSTHFTGYRVTYSDGETYDVGTTTTTHTRSSAPASQTITVSPLNDITGAGPASAGVLV